MSEEKQMKIVKEVLGDGEELPCSREDIVHTKSFFNTKYEPRLEIWYKDDEARE